MDRAYLSGTVTLDIARKLQADNPHISVFYCGLLISAIDSTTVSCDFDPQKRARRNEAEAQIGSVAHLMSATTSATRH